MFEKCALCGTFLSLRWCRDCGEYICNSHSEHISECFECGEPCCNGFKVEGLLFHVSCLIKLVKIAFPPVGEYIESLESKN